MLLLRNFGDERNGVGGIKNPLIKYAEVKAQGRIRYRSS